MDTNITTRTFLTGMLDDLRPAHSFCARTLPQWRQWRDGLRQKLKELAGMDRLAEYATADGGVEYGDVEEMVGYSRRKIAFSALKGLRTQAYLLVPGNAGDGRAMVALHGHGRGVDDVLGITDTEEDREHVRAHNYDYAVQLARRGYFVIAPNLQGFGESRSRTDLLCECGPLQTLAMMAGTTMLAVKLYEVARAVDVLQGVPGVNPERIGCLGLSGGGQMTMFAAALDDRIKLAVVSGYICQFKASILAMDHCWCNYVPGLSRAAENSDIASLIAPRPLFVESGTLDPIFPVQSARRAVTQIRKAYRLHGAQELLEQEVFKGPHRFNGVGAFDFIDRNL